MPKEKDDELSAGNENKETTVDGFTLRLTETFIEEYSQLPDKLIRSARKTIRLLEEHGFTPGMKLNRIAGSDDIWYIRSSLDLRITLSFEPDNTLELRRIVPHKVFDRMTYKDS